MYLDANVAIYRCGHCDRVGEADEWVDDPYIGLCCQQCGNEVRFHQNRPATWWSIGVYEVGRQYGGPEEGGWWYDAGDLVDKFHVRGFEDLAKARSYMRTLQDHYREQKDIRIVGFTEELPRPGFPNRRPVYC